MDCIGKHLPWSQLLYMPGITTKKGSEMHQKGGDNVIFWLFKQLSKFMVANLATLIINVEQKHEILFNQKLLYEGIILTNSADSVRVGNEDRRQAMLQQHLSHIHSVLMLLYIFTHVTPYCHFLLMFTTRTGIHGKQSHTSIPSDCDLRDQQVLLPTKLCLILKVWRYITMTS